MKTTFIILGNPRNDNFGSIFESIRLGFLDYFGSRCCVVDPTFPIINVECELSDSDYAKIKEIIGDNANFIAVQSDNYLLLDKYYTLAEKTV